MKMVNNSKINKSQRASKSLPRAEHDFFILRLALVLLLTKFNPFMTQASII